MTIEGLFHPYLLNIKQPSQIYTEGHAGNFVLMKLKGDQTVTTCVQSKLERESGWTRKSSTIVKYNNMIVDLVTKAKVPAVTSQTTLKQIILSGKCAVKSSIKEEIKDTWNTKVRSLTMQGDFVQILI